MDDLLQKFQGWILDGILLQIILGWILSYSRSDVLWKNCCRVVWDDSGVINGEDSSAEDSKRILGWILGRIFYG